MARECPKVQKSVKMAGFHIIGATIHTHQESLSLSHMRHLFMFFLTFTIKYQNLAKKTDKMFGRSKNN